MDQSRPPLSVVIVTFRSRATLPGALAALVRAAPLGTELVIVENGGDTGVEGLVRSIWPTASVVVSERNIGFAAGVNVGLSLATGEAILLLNPDAEVEAGTISMLRAALDSLPDAGIVAPRLLDEHGRPVLSCYPFLTPLAVAWRHLQLIRLFPNAVLGRYRRATLDPARVDPLPVPWVQGACLLVRRAMLDEVGPLDTDFFLYAEEVDFMKRAAQAGWRTYFVPAARVRHAEGTSSSQVVPLKLASHYLAKAVYFNKHHRPAEQAAVRAILLLDLALRMVYRAIGVVRGQPPDARQRLRAYAQIARLLATRRPDQLIADWRAQGEASPAPSQIASAAGRHVEHGS